MSQLGVVFIRMLLGVDAPTTYPNPSTAIETSCKSSIATKLPPSHRYSAVFTDTLRDLVMAMWDARKRRTTSCLSVLNNLPIVNGLTIRPNLTVTSPSVLKMQGRFWPGRSPEKEIAPISSYRSHHHSRWREDWEELEHLGAGGFGRVGTLDRNGGITRTNFLISESQKSSRRSYICRQEDQTPPILKRRREDFPRSQTSQQTPTPPYRPLLHHLARKRRLQLRQLRYRRYIRHQF